MTQRGKKSGLLLLRPKTDLGGFERQCCVGMLHINGHSFHTVSSFQSLLQAVDQYLQFQDAIPGLSAEVSHRIVELVKASTCSHNYPLSASALISCYTRAVCCSSSGFRENKWYRMSG